MFQKYLVTGATGFLGRAVIGELIKTGREIRALVLEQDRLAKELPEGVAVVLGDVCDRTSLDEFFAGADGQTCVIHCAGIVSVASHPGDTLYRVNVGGTNNVLRCCERHGIGRLVYVSSVHAIPARPKGTVITEEALFSPALVDGEYAKSKAIATSLVLEAAHGGLNASVVYPSGIIGPGDAGMGSITHMLISFLSGRMPFAVRGGYDFVDVRDVAAGIVSCAGQGKPGKGYILSGQYASVREILDLAKQEAGLRRRPVFLPLCAAKLAAPFSEKRSLRKGRPLYFTPYSVAVLASNGQFSREAAAEAFGYSPRPLQASIRDTVFWLRQHYASARPAVPVAKMHPT